MAANGKNSSVLLVQCPDETGLLYRISGALLSKGANVIENGEFVDRTSSHFFMRTEFVGDVDEAALVSELENILPPASKVTLRKIVPRSLVLMATKEAHCLGDLLLRQAHGDLDVKILSVISQYDNLEPLAKRFDIPFHFISCVGLSRTEHESRILAQLDRYKPDYLVLAKYMRILSPEFTALYPQRILNIHHSFLPAFVGKSPYQQAYDRGVKVLGATAHFVDRELDEGPIIAQAVIPTHHSQDARAMAHAGRDVERTVLAHALELVVEDRILVHGKRTIVFE